MHLNHGNESSTNSRLQVAAGLAIVFQQKLLLAEENHLNIKPCMKKRTLDSMIKFTHAKCTFVYV